MAAYRVENATAHFDVSGAEFDDLFGQVEDAIRFLRVNGADIRVLMSAPGASGGLDFATEYRVGVFHHHYFSADLVRAASELGLSLAVSTYPAGEDGNVAQP